MSIIKKQKYRILLKIEAVLIIIAEILDSVWHLSEYQFSNDIILLALVFPIWLFLFWIRKETLKPILKVCVYFCFVLLTIAVPLTFIIPFLE